MTRLVILGAGGHGKVVADTAEASGQWSSIVFYDQAWPATSQVADWPVLGTEADLLAQRDAMRVVVAIGHNATRWQKQQRLAQAGLPLATLVHPHAWVSPRAALGQGTVVFAGAVIQAGAVLGDGCIVNTAATVDHDCRIGAATHISPGAHLGGTVMLGERCWIGIGAVVRNNTSVGDDCTVGAGAVVVADAEGRQTLVGVPAKPLPKAP